jgi:hypothetical protein
MEKSKNPIVKNENNAYITRRTVITNINRFWRVLTMVYNRELLGFWTFSIVRYSIEQNTRRFGNSICFRPQMNEEKTPTRLGPLEKATEYRTMEKVQKTSNSVNKNKVQQNIMKLIFKSLGMNTRTECQILGYSNKGGWDGRGM